MQAYRWLKLLTSGLFWKPATSDYYTHLISVNTYRFFMETEMNRLRAELAGADHLAVIFDGSTYQGEALAILLIVNGGRSKDLCIFTYWQNH